MDSAVYYHTLKNRGIEAQPIHCQIAAFCLRNRFALRAGGVFVEEEGPALAEPISPLYKKAKRRRRRW